LFSVLPLPIALSQPVHIHGLFSISPDRARLYQLMERSTQDQNPAKWNNWLLQDLVPLAWTKLLKYLAHAYPHQPAFERWPQSIDDTRDPLNNATEKVIGAIEKESLALWPTHEGYVTAQNGLLDTGIESALEDALQEAGAPVVYIPRWLQGRAEKVFKDRLLRPQSLCQFMRSKSSQMGGWSHRTKHKILEYILSEPAFTDYGGLELFPFKDGMYRSIGEHIAFVHRNKHEEKLFALEDSHNLDLDKLSEIAQRALKQGCDSLSIHSSIRYRSARDLREYCMGNIFNNVAEEQDMAVLSEKCSALISEIWTWISMRCIPLLDKDISCLWLFPLSNGQHRKITPRNASSQIYLAPVGQIGELMWKFDAKSSSKSLPLLATGPTGLGLEVVSNLTKSPETMLKMFLKDAISMVYFLEWFHHTSPLLDDASDDERLLIARLVASHLPQELTSSKRSVVVRALSRLKIFQKVSWEKADHDTMFVIHFALSSSHG
jgi:sacsin